MANRVKITFPSNPTAFYLMSFSVFNVALGYSKWLSKTFVTGVPTATNQVRIGATLAETMTNLLANLNANDLDGIATFEASGTNGFYVNLRVAATWSFTNLTDPGSTITTLATETITVPEPETLPALDYKDISIRIYDTYENERILIQELASANACKIDFNGGDDLTKALAISKLLFNIAVLDAQDAKFLHLFSGDEKRYRVEVVGINATDDEQLLWRGFLLPDQYNEPYKQVLFFVDFTATDMIGSLKGKYFPAWYYQNTLPIAKVIAYCLEQTGLAQNLVVKPSVVPEDDLYTWEAISVNMLDFIESDKYKDCYEILEAVISSNLLTLYNFRGYWWLEGIHRRAELQTTNLQFNTNGDRIADLITEKELVDCGAKLQPTPYFNALTPFRQVNVNFDLNGTKNLYSDNIVSLQKSDIYSTQYSSGNYVGAAAPSPVVETYAVGKIKDWQPNLNSDFLYMNFNFHKLMWKTTLFAGSSYSDWVNGFNYFNYTETMVLNNYLECKEKPFVKPGVLYELETEFFVENVIVNINPNQKERIDEKLTAGDYDKLFPIQIFVDGVEKYSNRPSFGGNGNLRYETSSEITGYGEYHCNFTFKLKFQFKVEIEGQLMLRLLMPILSNGISAIDYLDDNTNISRNCFFSCNTLKLTALEGYDENEDLIAYRDVNFTQEYDFDIPISCTVDNSVKNSFAIGYPIDNNYIKEISRSVNPYEIVNYNYFSPTTLLDLNLDTFQINYKLLNLLFAEGKLKSCFMEPVSGSAYLFESLWYNFNNPICRLGYLTSYTGFPVLPKTYKAYPSVTSDDVLKYMHVEYAPENFANRLRWKLVGSTTVDTFPKTVAKALHGIQPETMFRLEASALALLWPCNLIDFYFNNEDKVFIPTTLNLDLFAGKTKFIATEAKFTELTDIQYE